MAAHGQNAVRADDCAAPADEYRLVSERGRDLSRMPSGHDHNFRVGGSVERAIARTSGGYGRSEGGAMKYAIRRLSRRWWRIENDMMSWAYFRWLKNGTDHGKPAWLSGLSEMFWTRMCGHDWVYAAKHGGIYWDIYTFDNQLKGDRQPGWHWPRRATKTKGAAR